jgi:hypothetical protein
MRPFQIDLARRRLSARIGEAGAEVLRNNAEARRIFDCAVLTLAEAIAATYQPGKWLKEPPKGEMFVWARPNGCDKWDLGLGYWNVSGGWSDAYGAPPRATRFHALPAPPTGGMA